MSGPPPYSAVLGELGLSSPQITGYEHAVDAEADRPIQSPARSSRAHPAADPRDADPELCLLM